jgi:DNA-binding MarR family transcriptional regulator
MAEKKNRNSFAATEAAFRALIRTFGLLKRVMEPYFGRFGISGAQWGVLRALHRGEQAGRPGLRLTDLGEQLLIRPPSVTGVIDRLQRLGLVARTASAADLRAKQVSLTPAGRGLVNRVLKAHETQIKSLLSELTIKEQDTLRTLLDRLGAHLEAVVERQKGTAAG